MNTFQTPDWHALLAARCPALVRADYLRDRDFPEHVAEECFTRPPFHWLDIHRFLGRGRGRGRGVGIGSGRGSGRGSGIGSGSGVGVGIGSGVGSGRGRGRGVGIGSGSGRGRGRGIGSGSGSGRGSKETYPETGVMRIGQAYLVHLGDWHTFVGLVSDQLGPLTYEMEFASKVDLEGDGSTAHPHIGDRWHEFCQGDRTIRRQARYWHQPLKIVVPLSIVAIEYAILPGEWGGLPHPDAPALATGRKAKAGAS